MLDDRLSWTTMSQTTKALLTESWQMRAEMYMSVGLCTSMCDSTSPSVALNLWWLKLHWEMNLTGQRLHQLFSTSVFAASWREQQCRHIPGNICDLFLWGNSPVIGALSPQASVSPPRSPSPRGEVRCVAVVVVVGAHFLY